MNGSPEIEVGFDYIYDATVLGRTLDTRMGTMDLEIGRKAETDSETSTS